MLETTPLNQSTDDVNNVRRPLEADIPAVAANAIFRQSEWCLLQIPIRIRAMIYRLIHVSQDLIMFVDELVKEHDLVDKKYRIKDIDSRILHPCRAVLQEAAPILYGGKNSGSRIRPISKISRETALLA